MRIRSVRIDPNQGGRVGCQVQNPFNWSVAYVTKEGPDLVVRDFDQREIGRERGITIAVSAVTAMYADHGKLCVTVAGFTPNTQDSALDTYLIDVP